MPDTEFAIVLVLLHHHVSQSLISAYTAYTIRVGGLCVNAWLRILAISFVLIVGFA